MKAIEYEQTDCIPSTVKGGEKGMVSEWEELEKAPKEDLIIELMYWRTLYSIIRTENQDSDWPEAERKGYLRDNGTFAPGERTTPAWAKRIALYGIAHTKTDEFCPCDLMDYGLCEDQCDEICDELIASGNLNLPEGVSYYDGREDR